ncbi:FAD-binding oxidoreductase [Streptomyces nitrosporeus]|uniref:FAD-binding oxidoreductase n=1 Tax=Streptomyces nitrosporeus TaxID=28894 RepID=UPI00167E7548|nr:FAD-binding protein [Streptomyces nitrosporeus]GGZ18694.1 4-cresol dehydrogenase [Streptomyces nitrosporeus]
MPETALQAALKEAERILGGDADRVVHPVPPGANVSMFRPRRVPAVVRPFHAAQVPALVRAFACDETPPLHAVSTGRNWGLGSREAAGHDAVRIELDDLDRIRDLDTEQGWAVVEPGVTQQHLSRALDGTRRMLNVTASSGHSSVLGNALDRGVGLRRQRTEDLVGLEVVLPDGEQVRVGWWPRGEARTAPNPYGLGPSLLHLFTQSNYGIVTAGVVRLLPRPETQRVLRLGFGRDDLSAVVDELRRWHAQGLVHGVLKIYDTTSATSYGTDTGRGGFLAHVSLGGTTAVVDALTEVAVEAALESGLFSDVARSDKEPPADDDVVSRVVEHGYSGSVVHHEEMLRSAVGRHAARVDDEGGGWLFFLPLVPFTGEHVTAALRLLDEVHAATDVRPGATVNALDPDVIDLVVSIRFARTDDETARAHDALDRLYESFTAAGYLPYRLDVDHGGWTDRLVDPSALALGRRLRQVIDPHHVIAPGRYA